MQKCLHVIYQTNIRLGAARSHRNLGCCLMKPHSSSDRREISHCMWPVTQNSCTSHSADQNVSWKRMWYWWVKCTDQENGQQQQRLMRS